MAARSSSTNPSVAAHASGSKSQTGATRRPSWSRRRHERTRSWRYPSVRGRGMTTVLVVDDDVQLRRFLRTTLAGHGHAVLEAGSIKDALAMIDRASVVLLDLGLPDGDGLEVLRSTKQRPPIIVLSARGHEGDKVIALDAGAEDYLTKPFGASELLARIRVVLRRASA